MQAYNTIDNSVKKLIIDNLQKKKETLDLSNIGLKEIPKMVFELSHLKVLKLMKNNIVELPKEISKLNRLTHLYLYQNKIRKLPSEVLIEMPFLECIDIADNLVEYDAVQNIYNKQKKWGEYKNLVLKLENLDLNATRFYFMEKTPKIPEKLFEFTNLKYLSINGKYLTEIPRNIGNLKKLEYLNFSGNKLSSIPNEILELTSLKSITLDNNEYSHFPEEILNMVNIEEISFNDNKITKIRPLLDKAAFNKRITYFSFGGNPLKDFNSEMFQGGIDYIREVVYQITENKK